MSRRRYNVYEDYDISDNRLMNGGHSISDYSRRTGHYDIMMNPYTRPLRHDRGIRRTPGFNRISNVQSSGNQSKMETRDHRSHDNWGSTESLDSTGKRKSFHRLCERFAEKTSMQGIPYINSAKLPVARILWTLLLLGAVGGMIYHLYYLFDNFLQFPKITKIELGFNNLRFPDVTVCNVNIIKQRNLQYLDESNELVTLIEALKPENVAPDMFPGQGQNSGSDCQQPGNNCPTDHTQSTNQQTRTSTNQRTQTTVSGPTESPTTAQENNSTRPPRPNSTPPQGNSTDSQGRPSGVPPPRRRRQTNENGQQAGYNPPLQNFNFSGYRLDLLDYLEDLELDIDEYDSPLDTRSKIYNLFTSYYMDIAKAKRKEIGHQMEEMLIACRFNQRTCNYKQFNVYQSAEYGNCWTINSTKHKLVVRDAGPSGGLELVLFLQTNEYLSGITNGYGLRLSLQRPNTHPFPYDQGIFISAATETSIGIKMKSIHRIVEPHGHCDHEKEAKFESFFGITYTRQACQATCSITLMLDECGCFVDGTEELSMKRLKNAHPCRSRKEEKCMVDMMRKIGRKEISCDCPNPCHEVEYIQAISQRQWPTDEYAKVLLDSACELDDAACDILKQRDNRNLNYNFLKLNIYYQDLNFENVTEEAEIETAQFLSDVGGALGLWIGLSILSMCELGQLIVELFAYCVHKSRMSNERLERRRHRHENRKLKDKDLNSRHMDSSESKGHLSVPSLNYESDNRSGRNSDWHDIRSGGDASPRITPRNSPRNSPWNQRRMRGEFGISPPTRY